MKPGNTTTAGAVGQNDRKVRTAQVKNTGSLQKVPPNSVGLEINVRRLPKAGDRII